MLSNGNNISKYFMKEYVVILKKNKNSEKSTSVLQSSIC